MKPLFFRIFLFCIYFFIPLFVFADIRIVSIFPNTVDDANLEYIDIRNTGCSSIDIGSYILEDASGKQYIFPSPTIIESKANFRISRVDSKIILNNTDETLFIKNGSGTLLDTYTYANSTKWVVIDVAWNDEACQDNSVSGGQNNTGSVDTSSESQNTGTGNSQSSSSGSDNISWSGNQNSATGWGQISSSGSNNSTWSQNNNTGSSFTGKLLAKNLGYLDSDLDGYIDTIFLDYGETLSWSLNKENIALYSNTGWLYANRINTETGLIQESSISGSLIFLRISPATQKKSLLKINNTTTSELRLKSSENLWVTTLSGQELEPLFLTSSFGDYKNIIHPNNLSTNTSTTDSWSTNTGNTNSWNTDSWVNIPFPEMQFTFQNYTNTTLSGNIFTCNMSPCRLNFTLEPIFTGGFLEKDYICRIEYAWNIYETCNPPQIYPTASFTGIVIQITWKSDARISNWYYSFIFENTQTLWGNSDSSSPIVDKNPPNIIIDFDGKKKSYYEQIGDYEYNCYTDTCSVNLTAERSYDPEWWKVRFIWMYDMKNLSESKDPGERKFTLWDHDIWLRVIDDAWNWSQVHYLVHVLGKKEEEKKDEKLKTDKSQSKKEKAKKVRKITKQKKKKKTQAIDFFDPPKVILQNTNAREDNWAYICKTNKKECSINFALSWAEKWIIYSWYYGIGEQIISINPRSYTFRPGEHTIMLTASYGTGDIIWSQNIPIQVIQEKKAKKGPKPKNKTKIVSKKVEKKVIPNGIPEIKSQKQEYSIAWALFLVGFSGIYLRKRRKISTSSR